MVSIHPSGTKHLSKLSLLLLFSLSLSIFISEAGCEELLEAEDSDEKPAFYSNWLDKSHSYILNRVNTPATWFDLFFGDPRTLDLEMPSTFVRLRTTVRFIEGEGAKFPVRLRANIKLPRASRKLRLIVTGENEDYVETSGTGTNVSATTITGEDQEDEQSSVGLRYNLYRTIRSYLHFGGGVSNLDPFDYYVRATYRRFLHLCDKDLVRFSQTGFFNSIDNFGETTRIDLERKMSNISTGRISFYGTYSDSSEAIFSDYEASYGVEWGVEANLFRQLSAKSALSLDLGVYGETRPTTEITNAIIAQRFRKNIHRPWLFAEVGTEVTFPLTEDEGRKAIGALSITFEIQFSK